LAGLKEEIILIYQISPFLLVRQVKGVGKNHKLFTFQRMMIFWIIENFPAWVLEMVRTSKKVKEGKKVILGWFK